MFYIKYVNLCHALNTHNYYVHIKHAYWYKMSYYDGFITL